MIGKRIKKLRTESDLLQKELARDLNLTQQTISLYESGKRQPDYETIEKIADYFKVSVDYLLGRTDIKRPTENLNDIVPKGVLELLSAEELDFLWDAAKNKQQLMLLRESRGLTNKDLAKAIKVIKAFVEDDVVIDERDKNNKT
ncbi:helix-turn-helix domain-containing protein [Natroniella sp. ANB-PHB2]|uniref:helix-turn-helix domain-containing protein n=1 Tax=Natroniella sp. ANB-PHB2 TaxID=3384444 RepID=UPI0038D48600